MVVFVGVNRKNLGMIKLRDTSFGDDLIVVLVSVFLSVLLSSRLFSLDWKVGKR